MLGATYVATTAVVHASDETEKSNVVETKILPTITIIANQLGGITENSGIIVLGVNNFLHNCRKDLKQRNCFF